MIDLERKMKMYLISHQNKRWYRVLTIITTIAVIILLVFNPFNQVKAVGVLTATMGASILAVLAGAGIYTVVSGMTWNEIQGWITDKLNEWDTYRNDGYTWDQLLSNNRVGATVSGFLKIEYQLASNICKFVDWLINNDLSMTNNDIQMVVGNTTSIDDLPCIYTSSLVYSDQNHGNNPDKMYNRVVYQENGKSFYVFKTTENYIEFLQKTSDVSTIYYGEMASEDRQDTSFYSANNGWSFGNQNRWYLPISPDVPSCGLSYSEWIAWVLALTSNPTVESSGSLTLGSDVIGIPDVETDASDIIINPGAYPGATTEQVTDVIIDGVIENTLDINMEVTSEFVDAQAVVVTNTLPISVNTDHHLFGFTLPSFDVNFVSIWHYVHDAITYSSGFISYVVGMLNSVPVIAIPVYMSFSLMIVLGFIRKVL